MKKKKKKKKMLYAMGGLPLLHQDGHKSPI